MKKHIAKNCIILLVFIVFGGLFQAWRYDRNPFKNQTTLNDKKRNYTFESVELSNKK